MTTKHTPGPWTPTRETIEPNICDMTSSRSPEETAANARLIAAAPDLLAALVAIEALTYEAQSEMQDGHAKRDVIVAMNRARAALVKAGAEG